VQVIVKVQVVTGVQDNMRMLVITGCTVYCRGKYKFYLGVQIIKNYEGAGWCEGLKLS
jgi:hypothetical protein